jgi:transposase
MGKSCIKNVKNLPILLMFQDEARFGRMSDPRSCWSPAPVRPLVTQALVREYRYEYAAIAPQTGRLDFMTADKMNTEIMTKFLRQVSRSHWNKFIIMVIDGASSHKSNSLVIPKNVSLIILPPYSPELNPSERIWNLLRRDYFANRYFPTLNDAIDQAEKGLRNFQKNKFAMKPLTFWPWLSKFLKAT